jgi:hypothetical protein
LICIKPVQTQTKVPGGGGELMKIITDALASK